MVVKNPGVSAGKIALLSVISVIAGLTIGGLFLTCLGINPFVAYATIIKGAFQSKIAIQGTVRLAIPLLISALGVSLAFKMKFWNIGAEGQIIAGGIFATYFALFHSNLPHYLLLLIMLVAGALGGGIWALIPAWFKCKYNTNETLFTLMMNYIALYFIKFFTEGPWRDPESSGFPKIALFEESARLDKVLGVHCGWIIALLLVVFVFIYLKYTKSGYEISVVGESHNTARYAGINVNKVVLKTIFLSGAICGIAGMCQVSGAAATLSEGIAGGVGFTAIIVSWLARLNAPVCLVISVLFAILTKGCSVMQSTFNISSTVSEILQGIILFSVLGFDFFTEYKLLSRKEKK